MVEPLGLYYPVIGLSSSKIWTLVAWCQMRKAFRVFRIDLIEVIRNDKIPFDSQHGQSLDDYINIQKRLYVKHYDKLSSKAADKN